MTPESKHGLGRKPSPKDDRDWTPDRLEALMTSGAAVPVQWNDPVVLDQGQTPHCVGYGGAGFIATQEANAPADSTVTNALGEAIYARCKAIDGDDEDGSTLRSLAKALQQMKVIDHYAFGTFADIMRWVSQFGPVVIGSNWYEGMEEPDAKGYVHATGEDVGGHCTVVRGASLPDYLDRNSWGKGWGPLHGDCLMAPATLSKALANGGEVLMAVKLVAPAPGPAPTPDVDAFRKLVEKLKKDIEVILKWLEGK